MAPASNAPPNVTPWPPSRQLAVTRPSSSRGTRACRSERIVTLAAMIAQRVQQVRRASSTGATWRR